MSKYSALWKYIQQLDGETLTLSFEEVKQIIGMPIDHSFLRYKKELAAYGWKVTKISMKQQTVLFDKLTVGENTSDVIGDAAGR